jgi:uncharacterized protein (TIGR00369 family)
MTKIIEGSHPKAPIQELVGFEIIEAEEGRTVFSAVPGPQHLNPIGTVHGGFAGLLLDSCMGAAVHTTCADGEAYSTLETKFNLVRAITPDAGEVLAEGRVVHRGRRVATAEGTVKRASDGKLLAHGTSTCMILAADGSG